MWLSKCHSLVHTHGQAWLITCRDSLSFLCPLLLISSPWPHHHFTKFSGFFFTGIRPSDRHQSHLYFFPLPLGEKHVHRCFAWMYVYAPYMGLIFMETGREHQIWNLQCKHPPIEQSLLLHAEPFLQPPCDTLWPTVFVPGTPKGLIILP